MGYWFGQVFLWAGFVGGAFNAVRYQEVVDDKWATVSWLWYGASMIVGIVGVILIRASNRAVAECSDRVESEFNVLTQSLGELLSKIEEFRHQAIELQPSKIVNFIDDELVELFADFADARNALIQRFGLQGFADVMTQFASGERFVNRAWSAAADGYRDEAVSSLSRALLHLEKADVLLSELANEAA